MKEGKKREKEKRRKRGRRREERGNSEWEKWKGERGGDKKK